LPRRSRGHTYRKRTPPIQPERAPAFVPAFEPGEISGETVTESPPVAASAAPTRSFVRGRTTSTVPAATASPSVRATRLITDYGYVVNEMKRIGMTFGGLVILLIVISRLLQ
jgi:hypothetical protein